MNKLILILFAAVLLTACGQKNNSQAADTQPAKETAKDFGYLNPAQNDVPQNEQAPTGKVITLTTNGFRSLVTDIDPARGLSYKGRIPCIVDFYADWCGPCRQLAPITERLAAKYKGQLIIYKVNVDKAQDICSALDIQSIPTLYFFKPNTQPKRMVGAPSEEDLDQTIQDFLR